LRLLREVGKFKPDVILFLKADDLAPWIYSMLRRRTSATLVAFHPDDPFNTGTLLRPGPSSRRAVGQIALVDEYFVWSKRLAEECSRVSNGTRVNLLPFGCDPDLHPRAPSLTEEELRQYSSDVTFVGNWDPKREQYLSAVARAGFDVAIWGANYWVTRCRDPFVRKAWRGSVLCGEEVSKAIKASKVSVNVLRRQNAGAVNMRTFEVPWVGGFMLHEASAELGNFFPEGRACDVFDSPETLVAQTRYYLEHPRKRKALAEEGARLAGKYTYARWAEALLAELRRRAPRHR
jgi:spore maturation protein CgeB